MKRLIPYIFPFLSGCIIAILMAVTMLKITMDFKILLILSSILYCLSGYLNVHPSKNRFLVVLLIIGPFSLMFVLLILNELPNLWYFIVIFIISTTLGLFFRHKSRLRLLFSLGLIAILFVGLKTIPRALEQDLGSEREDTLPEFLLNEMNGNQVISTSYKNKVLVLDFFGTWCKPCIQELEELDKVKDYFKDDKDVIFYVINADLGGDTAEKFDSFISSHNYQFRYAYDYDSKIYKLLNSNTVGLPTLLIVDKNQIIRYQHTGYNPAETDFSENIIRLIESLR